jgi:pyridoxal phosphate enzyme (YggS family)
MSILKNLNHIRQQIYDAEKKYQRPHGSVKLLAVSKQQSISAIHEAINAGQSAFGENYLQEALDKITTLKTFPIEWHFIGKIQSNKTQLIAQHFTWVHSVDRLKIAKRLDGQRPENLPPLNICIEVNISAQQTKSGVMLDELPELAHQIAALKNLRLRGLMAIPEHANNFAEQLHIYQRLQQAQTNLCAQGFILDTLSMGMSSDFEAAIAGGSTMVRIGAAVFGKRLSHPPM